MSTIITRAGKGSALTHNEVDANFNNLNTDKAEKTVANTFTANQIVSVTDNTNAALRITQLGTGNALLVEDSANPDASPFVIDATGRVVAGYTSVDSSWYTTGNTPTVWQVANSSNRNGFGSINYSGPGGLSLFRASGGIIGTEGAVSINDALGLIAFAGYDGINANAFSAAAITALVDLAPGNSSMPGRLVFSTTADGASTPTERMRIDSGGRVGIGATPSASISLQNSKTITGGTTAYGTVNNGVVQSGVTTDAQYFNAVASTAAASFVAGIVRGYYYRQATIGAGSSITNQYGFFVESDVTGATNNYGFYGNIASGANRWNLYMNGTAANYFAGDLTVYGGTAIPAGGTAGSGYKLSSTTNFGVFFGSGAPTLSAAKGSLYLRSDGTTTNNRMYVNTDGATTWTAVTTAA